MNQQINATENPPVTVACTTCGGSFQMLATDTKSLNQCGDCTAQFDAVMWNWMTPAHVAIAERERRTGEIPVV